LFGILPFQSVVFSWLHERLLFKKVVYVKAEVFVFLAFGGFKGGFWKQVCNVHVDIGIPKYGVGRTVLVGFVGAFYDSSIEGFWG
jgi:hypothetical protein